MALTLRRLAFAALVVAAVLAPLLRNGNHPEPTEVERRLDRLYLLRTRLTEAGTRWGALAERDSSALPAALTAKPGRPEVKLRGFGAASPSQKVTTRVNDLWTWLGPVDSTVRVALVLYNGAEYQFRQQLWWGYSGASISAGAGGVTCAAFVQGERQKDGAIDAGVERLDAALAPCLLLARFGPPGPALSPWLLSTRYAAAGSTAWLNRNRSFIDGGRGIPPPWFGYYWYSRDESPYQGFLTGAPLGFEIARMLSPPYELGALGLRCTNGDYAACRAGVFDTTLVSRGTRGLPADLTYSTSLLDRPMSLTIGTPRPPGEWWLSDLIRDQGREKFAKFWKSSASFEQAFRDAYGEDLGAWTHRWSVRQWENSWFEKYRHTPRVLGATLEPSWAIIALGWSGVALLLTAWVVRRRQVT